MNEFAEILNLFITNVIAYTFGVAVYGFIIYNVQFQEELVRRRVVKTSANGKKRSYSCNHCFSQIVICGECGEMFRKLH